MQRIVFVHFQENLTWHTEEHWTKITVRVESKRSVMLWLTANTTSAVVIHGGASAPSQGTIGWGAALTGSFVCFDFYFEDSQEAMMFKLAWS